MQRLHVPFDRRRGRSIPCTIRMASRIAIDPARSEARFHLHAIGVPVLRGTLPLMGGRLVIDGDGGSPRTANFQPHAHGRCFRGSVGRARDPRIVRHGVASASLSSRPVGARRWRGASTTRRSAPAARAQEHVLALGDDRGTWEQIATDAQWYRGLVRGELDCKAWACAHTASTMCAPTAWS